MGMFNDNVAARRTDWTYNYTGKDLWSRANALLEKHSRLETEARNKTADLLKDPNVSQNDSRFNELKREINFHGSIKEQCKVFVHEFARNPEAIFTLGLGDITFFEIV